MKRIFLVGIILVISLFSIAQQEDRAKEILDEVSQKTRSYSTISADFTFSMENTEMDIHAEALLFAAARSQHFHQKIVPALEAGKIIICDRFIDSSLAYQGYARGLGIDEVYAINEFAIGKKLPLLTIFIDVPPKVGLERVFSKRDKVDRLDLETLAFHERVYEGYMLLEQKFPDRFIKIDGTSSIEKVTVETIRIIETIL